MVTPSISRGLWVMGMWSALAIVTLLALFFTAIAFAPPADIAGEDDPGPLLVRLGPAAFFVGFGIAVVLCLRLSSRAPVVAGSVSAIPAVAVLVWFASGAIESGVQPGMLPPAGVAFGWLLLCLGSPRWPVDVVTPVPSSAEPSGPPS